MTEQPTPDALTPEERMPDDAGAAGAAGAASAADAAATDGKAGEGPTNGTMPAAAADAAHEPAAAAEPAVDADPAPPANGADASLLALIDRLAGLLDRSELTELEVQIGATGLVLRKPAAIAPQTVIAAPAGAGTGSSGVDTGATSASPAPGTDAATGAPARPAVMAPLSGIWYGSPAPGSAPYVSLGGEVAVGQVIGLIEAMKLFNEIKSDKAGRVVKINAENGKLVRAKQPLIEVEPL
jgi:acetyl-CoA carboxylase biotin carboxyl carrier protein